LYINKNENFTKIINNHFASPDVRYIGCFKDKQHNRAFPHALNTAPSMSFIQCKQSAENMHNKYFALQHGLTMKQNGFNKIDIDTLDRTAKSYCYTGPIGTKFDRYGIAKDCPINGGEFTNQVYELIKI
jgi:hypothetical protein